MDIFQKFRERANPELAGEMSAYMRNQFPFLGIPAPERKKLLTLLPLQVRKADWSFVFKCWDCAEREFQYLAVDYLAKVKHTLTPKDIPSLKKIATSKSWWDTIDGLDRIIGDIALRFPEVNKTLLKWSVDKNLWLRRIAIDHQLLRKDKTDTALLEQILVNNLKSPLAGVRRGAGKEGENGGDSGRGAKAGFADEKNGGIFFINKAIGWSLREYSKTNPAWVRKFIERHKGQMSPLSVREGGKYI